MGHHYKTLPEQLCGYATVMRKPQYKIFSNILNVFTVENRKERRTNSY